MVGDDTMKLYSLLKLCSRKGIIQNLYQNLPRRLAIFSFGLFESKQSHGGFRFLFNPVRKLGKIENKQGLKLIKKSVSNFEFKFVFPLIFLLSLYFFSPDVD